MTNETIYLIIYLSGVFAIFIGYIALLRFGKKDKDITIGDAIWMFIESLTSWAGIALVVFTGLIYGLIKLNECKFWDKKLFTIKARKKK
jgi:hypothetical protein